MALAARIEGEQPRGFGNTLLTLMDELPLAVLQLDDEGKILELNDTAQALLGSGASSEVRESLREVCSRVGPLTRPAEFLTRIRGAELRILLGRVSHPAGFVAVVERRVNDRLKAEVSALRGMLAAAVDSVPLNEAADRALRTIVGTFARGGLTLHQVDESRQLLVAVAHAGLAAPLSPLGMNLPLDAGTSSLARAALHRLPVHLADLSRSPFEPERKMAHGKDKWALLAMPVRFAGEVRGVLTICHVMGDLGEGELRMVQGLTDAMAALLARAQADVAIAAEVAARRSLMENLPDAIVEQGGEGVISLGAGRLEPILGRSAEDVIGCSIEELLLEEDRSAFRHLVESVREGAPSQGEFTVATPQGRQVPCEVSVSATGQRDQRVVRAVFRDISGRRTLESEVIRAREIATQREKLAAIGQLAAGVAHEINNPLSYVKSNLNTMASHVGELTGRVAQYTPLDSREGGGELSLKDILEEMKEIASESRGGIDRIANIVRALKGMARSHGDARAMFDPSKAIEDAVLIFRGAKKKCVVEIALEPLPQLRGSPGGLGQVLLNLMENAFDAMDGAGTVRIGGRTVDKLVRLTIADTGTGIPPDIRDRIFEPFFTTKEIGKGTGLGLYICWEMVKQMGGEISFETGPKGTTFTVDLPAPEDEPD
ncbi:MAG: PAS domain S-box protein [Deltaproteobacteria bacterium]|nr:PAS domain S-box protein [Deltaproteobacteria bacterium]